MPNARRPTPASIPSPILSGADRLCHSQDRKSAIANTSIVTEIFASQFVPIVSSRFLFGLGFGGGAEAYPANEGAVGARIPAGCPTGDVTRAAAGGVTGFAAGGVAGVGGCTSAGCAAGIAETEGVDGTDGGGATGGVGTTGAAGLGVNGSAIEGGGAAFGAAGSPGIAMGAIGAGGGGTGFGSAAGLFSVSGMKRVTAASAAAAGAGLASLAATAVGGSSSCSRRHTYF